MTKDDCTGLCWRDYSRFFIFSFLQRAQVQISVPRNVPVLCFMMLPQREHFSPAGTVTGFSPLARALSSYPRIFFILFCAFCVVFPTALGMSGGIDPLRFSPSAEPLVGRCIGGSTRPNSIATSLSVVSILLTRVRGLAFI